MMPQRTLQYMSPEYASGSSTKSVKGLSSSICTSWNLFKLYACNAQATISYDTIFSSLVRITFIYRVRGVHGKTLVDIVLPLTRRAACSPSCTLCHLHSNLSQLQWYSGTS